MASITYMIGHILCYDWLCYTCINTGIVGCHATGCLYFSVLEFRYLESKRTLQLHRHKVRVPRDHLSATSIIITHRVIIAA